MFTSRAKLAQRLLRRLHGTNATPLTKRPARPSMTMGRALALGLGGAAGLLGSAMAVTSLESDDAVFTNWSATHSCHPTKVYHPESLKELIDIVAAHHAQQKKLRCMGSGVSPNGLGFSDASILTMSAFDRILHVDTAKKQVTIESGVVVGDLLSHLRTHGLTLKNVASIREQSIAGVTQAGCHGTGAAIPPMEEQIVSMEILTPSQGLLTLDDPSDPRFQLAKCGLGGLGVVTKLTLQCVPMHKLLETTTLYSLSELKKVHASLLVENQHLRYMWLPYTDKVVVVTCKPYTEGSHVGSPVSDDVEYRLEELRALYKQVATVPDPDHVNWRFTQLRDSLYALDPLNARYIARVNETEVSFWEKSQGSRVALSDDVIGFDCGGQQLVSEVAFPSADGSDLTFMEDLLARIERDQIPAHTPIEQRWTASSRAVMSPASSPLHNQVFSWVGIIYYLHEASPSLDAIKDAFVDYSKVFEDVMAPYGATEHWAKLEFAPRSVLERHVLKDRLRSRFPLHAYRALRNEWDPHHILSNDFVDELCSTDL
ncbi:galactonolactone dehydrogenase [Saprolegnia diclina VS20]|uniref:Galactonolactone dehydrogenase n=1 Tax=Saprolegnia diclina (strain VS20) TaxID=1156394 RepID=T0QUI4_SAPDV|nr:galactonolactone dehydrogenase [Saprolegnia diclina VS20]EQC38351.1 galactonolactone dehydrogenase [Saprolegnia diclina VS20]|eukprot:XP_008607943.1 galactonolactone dehydrogenase [Saprolegnia diclina VS20]